MTKARAAATPKASAPERILGAALEVFVESGYEAASTNTIAARAGVAKGLVFHYYPSKEQLYLAVYDARVGDVVRALEGPLPADLFERLHALSARKLAFYRAEPLVYRFFYASAVDPPAGLRDALAARRAALAKDAWRDLAAGLDTSRLRRGTSVAEAMDTLSALADGLERRMIAELSAARGSADLTKLVAKLWTHFERLRDGLYGSP